MKPKTFIILTLSLAGLVLIHVAWLLLTPSIFAVAVRGNVTRMKKMLDEGADVNAVTPYNIDLTLLQLAVINDRVPMAELLLSRGARIEFSPCSWNPPPLGLAARHGSLAMVKLLVAHGADVNAAGDFDASLFYAINRGRQDVMQYLLEHGADPNLANDQGKTPLDFALELNDPGAIEILKAHGAKESKTKAK